MALYFISLYFDSEFSKKRILTNMKKKTKYKKKIKLINQINNTQYTSTHTVYTYIYIVNV